MTCASDGHQHVPAPSISAAVVQVRALAHESEGGASPTGASPSLMILNSAGMLLSLMAVRHAVTTRVLGPPARHKAATQQPNPGQPAVRSRRSMLCKQCALQAVWSAKLYMCRSLYPANTFRASWQRCRSLPGTFAPAMSCSMQSMLVQSLPAPLAKPQNSGPEPYCLLCNSAL